MCIMTHKAVLDYFFALACQYKYSFSCFFSFLLEYDQRSRAKILPKKKINSPKQEPEMKNLIQKSKG